MYELHHEALERLKNEGFENICVERRWREYLEPTFEVMATKWTFGVRGYVLHRVPEKDWYDIDLRLLSMRIASELIYEFEKYRNEMKLDLLRKARETVEFNKWVSPTIFHTLDIYDDGRDGWIGIIRLWSSREGSKYILFDMNDIHDYAAVKKIRTELVEATCNPTGWFRYALDERELVSRFKEQKRFGPRYQGAFAISDIDEWSRMPSGNLYRQVLEATSKRGYIDTDDLTEAAAEIRKAAKRAANTAYGINALYGITTWDPTKYSNIDEKETETMPIKNPNFIIPIFNPAMQDKIKDVIFNPPATIVMWKDGTKTVVKAENEAFDPEKGLAMAITKKAFGNKGHYFETIKKYTEPYKKAHETVEPVAEAKEEEWRVYVPGHNAYVKGRKYTRKNGKKVFGGYTYTDVVSDALTWKTEKGARKAALEVREFTSEYAEAVEF